MLIGLSLLEQVVGFQTVALGSFTKTDPYAALEKKSVALSVAIVVRAYDQKLTGSERVSVAVELLYFGNPVRLRKSGARKVYGLIVAILVEVAVINAVHINVVADNEGRVGDSPVHTHHGAGEILCEVIAICRYPEALHVTGLRKVAAHNLTFGIKAMSVGGHCRWLLQDFDKGSISPDVCPGIASRVVETTRHIPLFVDPPGVSKRGRKVCIRISNSLELVRPGFQKESIIYARQEEISDNVTGVVDAEGARARNAWDVNRGELPIAEQEPPDRAQAPRLQGHPVKSDNFPILVHSVCYSEACTWEINGCKVRIPCVRFRHTSKDRDQKQGSGDWNCSFHL
jgi:hypothetical protein